MADLDPAAVVQALASDPRLRVFTVGGRIVTIPARQSRRRMLLDVIAQAFEPGVRYPERPAPRARLRFRRPASTSGCC